MVVWNKVGLRRLQPRREGPSRPKKPPKVKEDKVLASVASKLQDIGSLAAWKAGLKRCSKDLRASVEKLVGDLLTGTPKWSGSLEVREQAILAAMLYVPPKGLYTYWCQTQGPAFAVDATLGSWNYNMVHGYAPTSCAVVHYEVPLNERFECSLSSLDGLPALRKYLAACSQEQYDEALKVGERYWESSPLSRRCLIAYLFPDQSRWANSCAQEVPSGMGYAWVLLACELSYPQAAALVGAATTRSSHFTEYLAAFAFSCSLVDIHGTASLELLKTLLGIADLVGDRRLVVEALGQLASPEAMCVCVELLAEKGLRKQLMECFYSHPELAREALQASELKEAQDVLKIIP